MINVLYFAVVRERVGRDGDQVDWSEGVTLGALRDQLVSRYPVVADLLPYVRFAVNQVFVSDLEHPLSDEDEVALIPPVSGGVAPALLTYEPIDGDALAESVYGNDCGALVTFAGRVRNHTGRHGVLHLDYEAYGAMAERVLNELLNEVVLLFPDVRLAVQHRLGHLNLGETAVFIAAASPHRAEAFAACQRLIDRLKEDVPIFKKEARGDGSVWVGLGP